MAAYCSRSRGRHDHRADTQIQAISQTDLRWIGRNECVIFAREAVFVNLAAPPPRLELVMTDAIQALDLGRQANLLGAAISNTRLETAVVTETTAQLDLVARPTGGYQQYCSSHTPFAFASP